MAKKENKNDTKKYPFMLLDESVTTYGFRVLIDGVDISQFQRNPVFLIYHEDYKLPAGKCSNVRKENKQILVDVEFDYEDKDEEVQRIIGKYERGFLRMVSAGLADLDISDDDIYKTDGQTMPTIIKSRLREVSAVGIGGNHNALRLYDKDGAEIDLSDKIKLSDFINPNKPKIKMNEELLNLLNLSDKADDKAVTAAVVALVDRNKTLDAEKAALQTKVDALELADKTGKKNGFIAELETAVKDGRINAAGKDHLVKLYDANPQSAEDYLSSIPKPQSVYNQISNAGQENKTELADLTSKDWDDLDKSGKLITLRDKYPDAYKDKYKEKFGVEPSL